MALLSHGEQGFSLPVRPPDISLRRLFLVLSALHHPGSLTATQRYTQARTIVRNSGRATNPAWYASPMDLPVQLHIRVDGERVDTWLYDRASNTWKPGPPLIASILEDKGQSGVFAADFLGSLPHSNQGLGVILHLAEDFATAELSQETTDAHSLSELPSAMQESPAAILEDKSLSPLDHGWGIFPYLNQAGKPPATAVVASRNFEPVLSAFRKEGEARKIPVRTCALSAPLLTLQALPFLVTANLACAFVAVFHYPRFTTLSFFNKQGNLLLLRSLPHRTQRRPHHLYFAINTTATALEFVEPQIVYLSYLGAHDLPLLEELTRSFGPHRISVVDWQQTPFHSTPHTTYFAEPQFAITPLSQATAPLAKSETFSAIQNEQWSLQDFLPPPREESELYPTQQEIKLLKNAKLARWGMVGLVGAVAAWSGLKIVSSIATPAWKFSAAKTNAATQKLTELNKEQAQINHWDNLLEDRSKAWATMELVSRMFPEGSGVQLRSVGYSIRAEAAPPLPPPPRVKGQPPPPPPPPPKAAIIREWKISGLASDEAVSTLLANLGDREGMATVFKQTAEATGDTSFTANEKTRTITPTLKSSENRSRDKVGFDATFELTIEQRFSGEDPLALITVPSP